MPKTQVDLKGVKNIESGSISSENGIADLIELTDEQEQRIKKILKREITDWENDTAELQEKLRHWWNLSEGIIEETDWPYEGAFETHIPMIGIYLKVYLSVERRSILGSGSIWYSEADPDADEFLQDQLPSIDNALNYKARSEWNVFEMMAEAFDCANRDGLSALKIPNVEEIEHIEDKILVESLEDFTREFESPQDVGMSEMEYAELAARVAIEASPETPLEIPVEYDRVVYSGPKAYLVERANLVMFPATARSLGREHCRGYGERFWIRREEVRRRRDAGEWYKKACTEFLTKTRKGGVTVIPDYESNKEATVGLSRSANGDDHEFFEIVYRHRLDKRGTEKKYIFVYSKQYDTLLSATAYIYRVDYFAFFRIERRANQMDGKSVVGQLEFLNEELDLLHNQRRQSMEITNIPSFKGKRSQKKDFDAMAEENKWHPGVIFWMEDPSTFDQFKIQPVDMGQSMAEESNLFKIAAFIMGVDVSLFSGKAPTEDPEAPGNKTAMLIDMGNLRMEDPLSELRFGVEAVGNICLSHLYQFGPPLITYKQEQNGMTVAAPQPLKKKILRSGIKIRMHGITVMMNADSEFNKWIQRYMVLAREPMVANNPQYRIEPLRRALNNGRVANADKILPSFEEVKRMQVETVKQAIAEMLAQQQAEQMAQDQAAAEAAQEQNDAQKDAVISQLKDQATVGKIINQIQQNEMKSREQGAKQ